MSATAERQTTQVTVIRDKVLVAPGKAKDVTEHGIILPPIAQERVWFGTVVAVGPDAEHEVRKGDRVLFHAFRGQEVWIEHVMYVLFVLDDGILARVVDEEAEALPSNDDDLTEEQRIKLMSILEVRQASARYGEAFAQNRRDEEPALLLAFRKAVHRNAVELGYR